MTFKYDMIIKAIVNNSTPIVIANASNTFVHEAMSKNDMYFMKTNLALQGSICIDPNYHYL